MLLQARQHAEDPVVLADANQVCEQVVTAFEQVADGHSLISGKDLLTALTSVCEASSFMTCLAINASSLSTDA